MYLFILNNMLHPIKQHQILEADIQKVWKFISDPLNLKLITPPDMNFKVLNETHSSEMYPGQIIEYHVSPFAGIRTHWVTEITQVKEGEFFIDEQRFGPYRFWHHEHHLRPHAQGTEMLDLIYYKIPGGLMGNFINAVIVQRKLDRIFNFRRQKLDEIFNQKTN